MANIFMKALATFISDNGEGELEPREIAQIACRVADRALEFADDKKLTPEEIFSLLSTAYEEFNKESND